MVALERELAVLDFETTGVFPRTDRVVEVGIVRLHPDGAVSSEYATLVNPQRDVGPVDLHGISATDVVDAPTFRDIAGDVIERLRGAIIVGHNVQFDLRFLEAELRRIGIDLPPLASICTLAMSRRFDPSLSRYRLKACCEEAGIDATRVHDALADARATAQLFRHYLDIAERHGATSMADLGCPNPADVDGWPLYPSFGRVVLRGSPRRPDDDGGYVRRLLARLDMPPVATDAEAAYLDVLERVLEDRRVTAGEAEELYHLARMLRCSSDEVRRMHRRYLRAVADAAAADGVVSEAENRDLAHLTALLGLEAAELADVMTAAMSARARAGALGDGIAGIVDASVDGKSVCFTGTLSARVRGQRITRTVAEELARHAGLSVQERVTEGLDILVVADPNTLSAKARRARDQGTRIIAEMAFWRLLGVGTD